MKIVDERIVEATETELYSYWLTRDFCDFYSFYDFLEKMKSAGCKVVDDSAKKCWLCKGHGYIKSRCDEPDKTCPDCHGTGKDE